MKRYLFLTILAFSFNTIASSTTEQCQSLRNQLSAAMKVTGTHKATSDILNEKILQDCFNAKKLVTNNYNGTTKDNYSSFINNLQDATTDVLQILEIMDQVDENLRQSNGSLEESQALVNSINVWQFTIFGEKLNAIVCGFGDDDYFVTTVFMSEDAKIVLMGAE